MTSTWAAYMVPLYEASVEDRWSILYFIMHIKFAINKVLLHWKIVFGMLLFDGWFLDEGIIENNTTTFDLKSGYSHPTEKEANCHFVGMMKMVSIGSNSSFWLIFNQVDFILHTCLCLCAFEVIVSCFVESERK